jgi:hypothetical protein
MSAPDTNIDTQTRRHAAPLIGIVLSLTLAIALLTAFLAYNIEPAGGGEADLVASPDVIVTPSDQPVSPSVSR